MHERTAGTVTGEANSRLAIALKHNSAFTVYPYVVCFSCFTSADRLSLSPVVSLQCFSACIKHHCAYE